LKPTICIQLLLFFFSLQCCSVSDLNAAPDTTRKLALSTVVIDAGHGGKDAGCISRDQKTYEKTLTLDIASTLATKIRTAYPDVKVIMTRSRDEYVTLDGRAQKANTADADLFISIHINSSTKTTPHGFSVHVLGKSSDKNKDLFAYNMDVCQRENSVIMLEDDYTTKYEGFDPSDPESYIFMVLMQNSYLEQSLRFAEEIRSQLSGGPITADRGVWQNPFYVLWRTSMPAVLVELGFMSNSSDLAVLRQKAKRDELAERLFKAFKEYKTVYDASLGEEKVREKTEAPEVKEIPEVKESKEEKPSSSTAVKTESSTVYAVQVFALSRVLPDNSPLFLGYKHRMIKSGKLYKYFLVVSSDRSKVEAEMPEIKKKYPDAFLVKIEDGNVSKL